MTTKSFLISQVGRDKEMVTPVARMGCSYPILASRNHNPHANRLYPPCSLLFGGDRLCEGEGYGAIRTALEQGRICDFFTIVRGILNTYSPDSPYVSLSDWEGEACYECGHTVDSENSYYCGFCDHAFCEECFTCCRGCDETVCLSCSQQCPHCEENVCPNCMKKCSECGSLCCILCLEDDLCPKCVEELEKEDEQPQCQVDGTDKNAGPDQPQTGKPEVRLAG